MKVLGYVVSGSINSGVRILLNSDECIENYPIGSLAIIKGKIFTSSFASRKLQAFQ